MFLKKLPLAFQKDTILTTIGRHLQNKKVLLPMMLYCEGNKRSNILENDKAPKLQKDWQCYSLLRGLTKTQMISDKSLKVEYNQYKTLGTHGNKDIQEMLKNFHGDSRRNVYVLTRTMKRKNILPFINQKIYNLLNAEELKQNIKDENVTLREVVEQIKKKDLTPLMITCGNIVLKDYFDKIKSEKQQNIIDAGYFANFQGEINKEAKGTQLQWDSSLFDTVWKSDPVQVNQNGKNIGKLTFEVYQAKNK